MRPFPWRRRLALSMFALTLAVVPACTGDGHVGLFGYTSAPNFDKSIRTIYVPMAGNKTLIRGSLEFDVTRTVVNEIQLKTPYRVVHSPVGADTELQITVLTNNKSAVNINQNGEIRDAQIGLVFGVVWLDLRPGHNSDVLSGPKRRDALPPIGPDGKPVKPTPTIISPIANYIPELGGSNASATQAVIQQLATQIVSMMEISGTAWK